MLESFGRASTSTETANAVVMPGASSIGAGVAWRARAALPPPRRVIRANRQEIRRRMRGLLSGELGRSGGDARFDEGEHVVQLGEVGANERTDHYGLGEREFVVEADGEAVIDFDPGGDLDRF